MTKFASLIPPRPVRHAALRSAVLAAVAVFILGGCAAEVHVRGNKVDEESLALIKPGQQTRDQVIELLGSPTSVAAFDNDTIYYITQRTKLVTFHPPEVLSRTVIAINFDDSGRVREIAKLDLEDGKPVVPVGRITPTPGRQFTLLQQLIGNFGRFETGEERSAE